tara:strand:- start:2622 stop:3131 length:510 start_codon:yes stop_codon:yes gene_type:complete
MILWISGISGVGKTTLARKLYKLIKKKTNNVVWIDGDQFRKIFNNDLKYTLKDRNKNAQRICSFVKFLSSQNINIILSANLTSNKYRSWCKKNLKNYISVYIDSSLDNLFKRDKKNIYNNKKLKKNVVGLGIKKNRPTYVNYFIQNNSNKKAFLGEAKNIMKLVKKNYF